MREDTYVVMSLFKVLGTWNKLGLEKYIKMESTDNTCMMDGESSSCTYQLYYYLLLDCIPIFHPLSVQVTSYLDQNILRDVVIETYYAIAPAFSF